MIETKEDLLEKMKMDWAFQKLGIFPTSLNPSFIYKKLYKGPPLSPAWKTFLRELDTDKNSGKKNFNVSVKGYGNVNLEFSMNCKPSQVKSEANKRIAKLLGIPITGVLARIRDGYLEVHIR